jgi:plastocyanin
VRSALAIATLLAVAACGADVPPELQPDSILRVSLGLSDRDVVHRVRVLARGTAEVAVPAQLSVRPGSWVQFQGGDARGHVVRFDTLTLSDTARVWLRATDQLASPPLLTSASRWVVSFEDAPPGMYPFEVVGSGETGQGWVDVVVEER